MFAGALGTNGTVYITCVDGIGLVESLYGIIHTHTHTHEQACMKKGETDMWN